jgi:hypothetical protein
MDDLAMYTPGEIITIKRDVSVHFLCIVTSTASTIRRAVGEPCCLSIAKPNLAGGFILSHRAALREENFRIPWRQKERGQ